MAKWKCEICGNEFDNFHAQGFDNKIYCPLCYFKKENQELKEENKQLKDNWNMLKEHLKNRYDNGTESISYRQVFMEIREAMQVLEIAQELKGSDKE